MQGKTQKAPTSWAVSGSLVAFPADRGRQTRLLDGFYRPGPRRGAPLLVFVHGMGSNFYRSALKKAFLQLAPENGFAVLSYNNRGAERGTEDEPFSACLADLDAAVEFGRRHGHRRLFFVGHSTGCQKIVFWQSRRRARAVSGLVLLAPADDYAITRQALGRQFDRKVAWARKMLAAGKGSALIQALYERFTAKRFLSIANPRAIEANIFRYAGPLTHFRRVKVPMYALFGDAEEFAALPPAAMLDILQRKAATRDIQTQLVVGANHSFKGHEAAVARAVCRWARERSP